MSDNVNSPSHYQMAGLSIEVIDVIRSVLGDEKFEGYCRGNVIKYILRADKKNEIEDLKKARVYLNWEIESKEKSQIYKETSQEKVEEEKIEEIKVFIPTSINSGDYECKPYKVTLKG